MLSAQAAGGADKIFNSDFLNTIFTDRKASLAHYGHVPYNMLSRFDMPESNIQAIRRCVDNHRWASWTGLLSPSRVVYKVQQAVLWIFGKSDWQLASWALSRHVFAVVWFNHDVMQANDAATCRPGSSWDAFFDITGGKINPFGETLLKVWCGMARPEVLRREEGNVNDVIKVFTPLIYLNELELRNNASRLLSSPIVNEKLKQALPKPEWKVREALEKFKADGAGYPGSVRNKVAELYPEHADVLGRWS